MTPALEHTLDKAKREARLLGRGRITDAQGRTGREAERRAMKACRKWIREGEGE